MVPLLTWARRGPATDCILPAHPPSLPSISLVISRPQTAKLSGNRLTIYCVADSLVYPSISRLTRTAALNTHSRPFIGPTRLDSIRCRRGLTPRCHLSPQALRTMSTRKKVLLKVCAQDTLSLPVSDGHAHRLLPRQVIILGDSGVGKTSLMNQYVRGHLSLLVPGPRSQSDRVATDPSVSLFPSRPGQQKVQRELQGDDRGRFLDAGGAGRRPAGHDAGARPPSYNRLFPANVAGAASSGTRPGRNASSRWAWLSTAGPTAACWYST